MTSACVCIQRPAQCNQFWLPAVLGACLFVLVIPDNSTAQTHDVKAKNGVVVSVSAPASEAGLAVLKQGGNAVDAAVATAFALAVTYPQAGNIGGGGFMVVYPGKGQPPQVVEYREKAPGAVTVDTFVSEKELYGHKVVGVPGTVRGMELAHKEYGKLPWKDVVLPAVKLAEKGFALDKRVAKDLNKLLEDGDQFPEMARVFGRADNSKWQAGDKLVQPDLAKTLALIANEGAKAFYTGKIADQIVAEMKAGGGLITRTDLVNYEAHLRPPIHGVYRGHDIYAPPPPCSGGMCLVEMLNILETFNLKSEDRYSPRTMHCMIEAMRRGFYDRARYLGDPAFTSIPLHLISKKYAKELAASIIQTQATPSAQLAKDIKLAAEGDSTTHFSVIDRDGMAVSNTYTLERGFGSKVVVKGAGFLLNNEMLDFNWKPGYTDTKGSIGTKPNQVAPGKKMLSSMTPVIVAKNGKVVLVTGSPGGRTIINTVLCVLINVLEYDMDVRAAVDAPRHHHQWMPDEVTFEAVKQRPELVQQLEKMGHKVVQEEKMGNKVKQSSQGDAHSIQVDTKTATYFGAADKRLSGSAAGY